MHPSEWDDTETAPQDPSQEEDIEEAVHTSSLYRIWKESVRSLEGRDHESFNWNTAFTVKEGENEGHKYYKAMHEDDYCIHDEMEDSLAYQAISDPDTM